jgi:hypothetical protein
MFFSKCLQPNSITTADGLPDGSGKPAGHASKGVDEDLQRTAGTKVETSSTVAGPLCNLCVRTLNISLFNNLALIVQTK